MDIRNFILLYLLSSSLLSSSGILGCSKARKELEETVEPIMALPEKTRVKVDLLNIRRAIEFYKADKEGKIPGSLEELKLNLHYPGEYEYDVTTGKVKSKNYPDM